MSWCHGTRPRRRKGCRNEFIIIKIKGAVMEDLLPFPVIYLPVAAFAGGVGMILLFALLSRFLFVCRPNEILIFSGRRHRSQDGSEVGFRVEIGSAHA